MSNRKALKEKLKELPEKEFHKVLEKLFEEIGFLDVRITHGTTEFGKDLVFYEEDKFGKKNWIACIVKKGDVNQTVYHEIIRQIFEAYRKPYDHHIEGKVKINHVYVVASGIYKDNARALISEEVERPERPIKYFENGDIATLLENKQLDYLLEDEVEDIYQASYKSYVAERISDKNNIKFLEADFGIRVDAIDDFRVNVRAKSKAHLEERKNYVEEKETTKIFKLLPEIDEILTVGKPFLLHGIATSGKSTILKKLGKDFLKLNPSAYLFFFDLNKIIKDEEFSLLEAMQNSYRQVTGEEFVLRADAPILVLLDGLDEVGDTVDDKLKNRIIEEVIEIKANPNIQVILTSRTIDFVLTSKQLEIAFEKFELLPLNYNEMIQIGNKILSTPDQARKFVHLVKNSELLQSFPKTPLTTILLAILLKEEKIDIKELPKNITELYSKFIDLFLNKWDKGKGISEQYKIAEKDFVLKRLAEELHKANKISFTEEEIIDSLSKIKTERPIDILNNPKDFLNNICERTSLLTRDASDNSFRFFHLTFQEYLAASALNTKDESILIDNFLDDWWLNPNIFYAGRNPSESQVLKQVSSLTNFPISFDDRMKYIINTSKILKAVHLWDHESRKRTITSILKVFEGMIADVVGAFIGSEILTRRNKSLLDVVLWSRGFVLEFLDSDQFVDSFKIIWKEMLLSPASHNDILRYCIAYNLAIKEKKSIYLEEFIDSDKTLNPRWFKIVYVDIDVKKLVPSNKKLVMKFKQKASEHKKYIQKQFQDRLIRHYTSITGLPPMEEITE